jgi:hypothetical protein
MPTRDIGVNGNHPQKTFEMASTEKGTLSSNFHRSAEVGKTNVVFASERSANTTIVVVGFGFHQEEMKSTVVRFVLKLR